MNPRNISEIDNRFPMWMIILLDDQLQENEQVLYDLYANSYALEPQPLEIIKRLHDEIATLRACLDEIVINEQIKLTR